MAENGDTKQKIEEIEEKTLHAPLQRQGTTERIQRAPFETALHYAGNGIFQWVLLFACGAVYAVCALSTTTLSFVLPAATKDFDLKSSAKGQLTATPLIGMCIGSYFWGNLADARGRKKAIMAALLVDAVAAFISSLMQSFSSFLAFRFFSGFGIIGATGLVFPYFGDFLSLRHRDVMLCRLEVFWTIGTILLPGIAWLIIRDDFYNWTVPGAAGFQYTSWRVFVAACGIPSLLVAMLLLPFPESPRYLLHAHKPEEALKVLQKIFVVNTRLTENDFPVETMIGAGEEGDEEEVVAGENNNETKPSKGFKQRLQAFWDRKKMMVSQPYIGFLALCCFVDFGLMFSYYTLMMWFPDLFERFSEFTAMYGTDVSAGVCEVTANLTQHANQSFLNLNESLLDTFPSINDGKIKDDTYIHTLIVAVSCLPTALFVGCTINMIGKKVMLVLMLTISGCAALGLNLVTSSYQNVVLSCIFEAIVSCTEAVLFCVICEIFPTKIAATAMAVTVMCGRIGAIVGNVAFGALVDNHCVVPIYMFGALLISSGLLCIVLPKSERPARPQL